MNELPPYVEESLKAWCALQHARQAEPVPEVAQRYGQDPTYDPESDWLDEPFPEELK